MYVDDRPHTDTAWMNSSYLMLGWADAKLNDGRNVRIERRPSGEWAALIGLEEVAIRQTWEFAFDELQWRLSAQGIFLRWTA